MTEYDAPRAAPSLPLWCVERILYDADGLLVVDKPCGIPVHGGDETLKHDCVTRLREWLKQQGRDEYLAVHQRLDQATSGLLFFATDAALNPELADAMEQHTIRRKYIAVVESAVAARPEREDRARHHALGRGAHSTRGGRGRKPERTTFARQRSARYPSTPAKVAVAPLSDQGVSELFLLHENGVTRVVDADKARAAGAQRALTRYRVLRRVGTRALVELELETGRTHQIRVTLAQLGWPIIGDRLYGGSPSPRLCLHAYNLSGGPLPKTFQSPAPACFEELLQAAPGGVSETAIRQIVRDAAMLRAPLALQTGAFRLINADADGAPGLTVDVYGPFATLNIYEAHWQGMLAQLGAELLALGFSGVYLKQRVRSDLRQENVQHLAPELPIYGETAPESFLIDEHGMLLNIELADGLSTGLFVDMREGRRRVRSLMDGRDEARMLNLFCYTGSFSVAAALGGAKTTSVDLSGRAVARVRRNFESNKLAEEGHRFFKEDAMKFLAKSVRRGDRYDVIVLDPPSFATVGKGTFSVAARYVEAAADCFRLLVPGGHLLCVTNHLKTVERAFLEMVKKAAGEAGRELSCVRSISSSFDCPAGADGPFPSKAVLATVR